MVNTELQQLAKAYIVEHSYHKDVADDTEEFLRWLTKTHCIVSREKVRELYDCYRQHEAVSDEKGLREAMLIARGSMAAFRDIFDKSTFE